MSALSAGALAGRLAAGWPRRNWALLDVREAGEADAGHIPGATFLPRRQIEARAAELLPTRSVRIVLYDGDDGRAELAAETFRALGYTDVHRLDGGIGAWRRAGHPVATGSNVPSKAFGERVLAEGGIPYTTADRLRARMAAGERIVICDVRTPEEHRQGCIPGGHSAPSFDIALHAEELAHRYDSVVVNCAGRTRSIIGTATLRRLGFGPVEALENGTMGWRLAGHALETGADRVLPPAGADSVARVAAVARRLAEEAGVRAVDPASLRTLLADRDRKLLYAFDVRPLDAYRRGHITGSVALPGGQAVQRTDDFVAIPGAPVVFIDDGDARAWLTAWWFRRMGFGRVFVLAGGLPAWRAAGLPLETGRGRTPSPLLCEARIAVPQIGADSLAAMLRDRLAPVLLDVGTSRHYAEAHLPGARWIARGWLEARAAGIGPCDTPLVVTARDPDQAVLAAATLRQRGFRNATALREGTAVWAKRGHPVERGLPGGMGEPGDVVDPPYHKGVEGMRAYLAWEVELAAAHQAREPGTGGTATEQGT